MESARVPRGISRPERLRFGLIAALLALALVGWIVTDARMSGMDMGPGTDPGTLGFYIGVWVVMMAAMMFPSIAPMVVIHARVLQGKRERGDAPPPGATISFVAGYLVTWTLAGLGAYVLFEALRSLHIGAFSWDSGGPYVAGGVIVLAAIYQLTPLKDACLTKCRSPMMFVLTSWRDGRVGALRMGLEHGAWCLGCCWALMAALFALGVMSVGWMAFVAALIALEKLWPSKLVANRAIAGILLVLGLGVAFVPGSVPGLTTPDEAGGSMSSGMSGMKSDNGMKSDSMKPDSMKSGGTKPDAMKSGGTDSGGMNMH